MRQKEIYVNVANNTFKIITTSPKWYKIYLEHFERMRVSESNNLIATIRDGRQIQGKGRIFALIKLMIEFLKEDFLFFHASAVGKNGKAILFVGPEDSGKTTAFLYGIMYGYRGLSDEILLYSLKEGYIYPLQFRLYHSSMISHFEKIFQRKLKFRYVKKAKPSKIFLLRKVDDESSLSKISFLFQNCYNSYLEKHQTYIKILNLVSTMNPKIKSITPLDIFKNFNKTESILKEIFKEKKQNNAQTPIIKNN